MKNIFTILVSLFVSTGNAVEQITNDIKALTAEFSPPLSAQEQGALTAVKQQDSDTYTFEFSRDENFRGFNCERGMMLLANSRHENVQIKASPKKSPDAICSRWGYEFKAIGMKFDGLPHGVVLADKKGRHGLGEWRLGGDPQAAVKVLSEMSVNLDKDKILVSSAKFGKGFKEASFITLAPINIESLSFPRGSWIWVQNSSDESNKFGKPQVIQGMTLEKDEYVTVESYPCYSFSISYIGLEKCELGKDHSFRKFIFLEGSEITFADNSKKPNIPFTVKGKFKLDGKLINTEKPMEIRGDKVVDYTPRD